MFYFAPVVTCTDIETQQFSKIVWRKVWLLNLIVACSFLSLKSLGMMYKIGVFQDTSTLSPILMLHLYNGGFSGLAKVSLIHLSSLKTSDFPRRIFIFSDAENPADLVSLNIVEYFQAE